MDETTTDKLPEWVHDDGEGTVTVTFGGKKFVLKEQKESVMSKCIKLSENTGEPLHALLATRSLVEPKITDAEFKELGSRTTTKLKYAAALVNGVTDFF